MLTTAAFTKPRAWGGLLVTDSKKNLHQQFESAVRWLPMPIIKIARS